ncbi:VOC family protein [Thalassomonas actiniarum]|uniref:VOC family protein n=1 Tax=Thalassomonas actiniarum TaxID=485447 RepID=A0AAF0C1A8_9GAMM|nr:VOC family protein [Thalassomonas actiniarum]WDD98796.1 VOC family protein [Thalassomonas actiniarum]
MLAVNGIDHINLKVADLAKTCAFYHALFGFEELRDMPEVSGKIIGNKQAKLALYQVDGFEKYEKHGFSHVSFQVDNFEQALAACEKIQAPIKYNGILEWEKSRSLYILDPNGYEIELAEVWGGGL